jgi:GNAT superfamily N-acetyltransferase
MYKKKKFGLSLEQVDNMHINILNGISQKFYEIVKNDNEKKVIYLKKSEILIIEDDDINNISYLIKKYRPLSIITHSKDVYDYLNKTNYFINSLTFYQGAISKSMIHLVESDIIFRKPLRYELSSICEAFQNIDEADIKKYVDDNKLVIAIKNGNIIGCIGEKDNYSIGFLYVFPQYRGNGYGKEIVSKYTETYLKNHTIGFINVQTNDCFSIEIFSEIGYKISNNKMYCLYNKYF